MFWFLQCGNDLFEIDHHLLVHLDLALPTIGTSDLKKLLRLGKLGLVLLEKAGVRAKMNTGEASIGVRTSSRYNWKSAAPIGKRLSEDILFDPLERTFIRTALCFNDFAGHINGFATKTHVLFFQGLVVNMGIDCRHAG